MCRYYDEGQSHKIRIDNFWLRKCESVKIHEVIKDGLNSGGGKERKQVFSLEYWGKEDTCKIQT
jgi:hypothetical protein